MGQIQCSTCGDTFDSWAELADHKKRNHWVPAASARQRLGRRILRAALMLTAALGIGSAVVACGDPSPAHPAYALECFPSLQPPTVCTDEPRGAEAPPETSTTSTTVLAPSAADAPVEPDPMPAAVSPEPLCISPSQGRIPCGSQDVCADAVLCPPTPVVAVGEPPVLPATGGSERWLVIGGFCVFAGRVCVLLKRWRRGGCAMSAGLVSSMRRDAVVEQARAALARIDAEGVEVQGHAWWCGYFRHQVGALIEVAEATVVDGGGS